MTTTDRRRPLKQLEITSAAFAGLFAAGHHDAFDVRASAIPSGARIVACTAGPTPGIVTLLLEHETFDLVDLDVAEPVPSLVPVIETCGCEERTQ